MIDLERLSADLIHDESEKLRLYRCPAGKLTIGVGHNIEDRGISLATSRFILREDIETVLHELDAALPWWREMGPDRQRAIANLAFNVGVPKLLEFKKTIGFLRAGEYLEAAQEVLRSRWATQVGDRAVRLAIMVRGV